MCTGLEVMAVANLAQGVGGFFRESNVAEQREARMGQIAESASQSIRQKATAQARRRGAQKAAFGKAGVTLTGAARQVLEEQIEQDELELYTDRYNAQLQIGAEAEQAAEARTRAVTQLLQSGAQAGSNLGLAG